MREGRGGVALPLPWFAPRQESRSGPIALPHRLVGVDGDGFILANRVNPRSFPRRALVILIARLPALTFPREEGGVVLRWWGGRLPGVLRPGFDIIGRLSEVVVVLGDGISDAEEHGEQ